MQANACKLFFRGDAGFSLAKQSVPQVRPNMLNGTLAPYLKRIEFLLRNACNPSFLTGKGRVLIVGCGDAEEALSLHSRIPTLEIIGVDISAPQRYWTEKKIDFVRADACNIPLRGDAVQLCYCFHVLEHVTDPSSCISEITQFLTEAENYSYLHQTESDSLVT